MKTLKTLLNLAACLLCPAYAAYVVTSMILADDGADHADADE